MDSFLPALFGANLAFGGIVSSPPKTVGGNQNFRKISCGGGGNKIFLDLS